MKRGRTERDKKDKEGSKKGWKKIGGMKQEG